MCFGRTSLTSSSSTSFSQELTASQCFKRFAEGTGLGLTIAHQIIREHRGEIQVQSTEGVGTTFRINLPSHQG